MDWGMGSLNSPLVALIESASVFGAQVTGLGLEAWRDATPASNGFAILESVFA